MKYPGAQEILAIHDRLVEETGGALGVRDIEVLHSATERPKTVVGGEGVYPDVFKKAASLLESIVRNHPFVDGNKRTAYVAAVRFLDLNGYILQADTEDAFSFMVECAKGEKGIEEIAEWLEEHSERSA